MRVLLFTDTFADINGVARFVRDAANWARTTGHDLRVITSTPFSLPEGTPAGNVINIVPWGSLAIPGYADLRLVPPPFRRARELVRDLRPDLVHVSTPGPVGIAGRRAALAERVPLVGTYHTDFPAYVSRLYDDEALTALSVRATGWFYAPFARILTRSADYARRLKDLGFHCSMLRRLTPGTDVERFHPGHRTRPREAGPLRLLYVGRVSVEKNFPFLSRVWRRVGAALGSGVELRVVGGGPYLDTFRREHAGDSRVSLTGFCHGADLCREYADGDVFLFPSQTDTLGQAVMEAQASGVPALVSDQGGPREIVRDGRTGRVLACEEGLWLAAVAGLARDAAARRAMGEAARAHMENHSIADSLAAFWREHERVLAGGPVSRRMACGQPVGVPDIMPKARGNPV